MIGNTVFGAQSGAPTPTLPIIILNYINVFLGFLGILLVIFIIVAGWQYFQAKGDGKDTAAAVKRIVNAVIGLMIILAAFGIALYVDSTIAIQTLIAR